MPSLVDLQDQRSELPIQIRVIQQKMAFRHGSRNIIWSRLKWKCVVWCNRRIERSIDRSMSRIKYYMCMYVCVCWSTPHTCTKMQLVTSAEIHRCCIIMEMSWIRDRFRNRIDWREPERACASACEQTCT